MPTKSGIFFHNWLNVRTKKNPGHYADEFYL